MNAPPSLPGFQIFDPFLKTAYVSLWHAYQENLERQVIITVFRPKTVNNIAYRQKTVDIIRILSNAKLTLFPEILDVLQDPNNVHIITEDASITNILSLLKGQRLNTKQIIHIATQLAKGFEALHQKGLAHNTFSPRHLFITEDANVLLPDITALKRMSAIEDAVDLKIYTDQDLVWLAPEQHEEGVTDIDVRIDIFSVGMTLYALASGQIPFGALSAEEVLEAKFTQTIPSPCDISRSFPPELAAILSKMTQRDPANRYQTWQEVHQALQQFQAGIFPETPPLETSIIAPPTRSTIHKEGKTIHLSAAQLRTYRKIAAVKKSAPSILRALIYTLIGLSILALLLTLWVCCL